MARSLERGLTAEGYVVDVCFDGAAGLEAATNESYAAILLDVKLPLRNGFALVAELRNVGCSTAVLMLTAKDGSGIKPKPLMPGPMTTSPNRSPIRCFLLDCELSCVVPVRIHRRCSTLVICHSILVRASVAGARWRYR